MSARTILVADEDIDTRIILRTLLERHGYGVVEASSSDDALKRVGGQAFDLVILNHPMLTRGGRSLVQQLRQLEPSAQTPILNITSRVIPQFIEEAALQGVTMTIAKPIDVQSVLYIVADLTSSRAICAN